MIHFDTNFLIQTVVAGSPADAKVHSWALAQEEFNVSSVVCMCFRSLFPDPWLTPLERIIALI
jgi:hypothetical protein